MDTTSLVGLCIFHSAVNFYVEIVGSVVKCETLIKTWILLGLVVYACKLSTWEADKKIGNS